MSHPANGERWLFRALAWRLFQTSLPKLESKRTLEPSRGKPLPQEHLFFVVVKFFVRLVRYDAGLELVSSTMDTVLRNSNVWNENEKRKA